MSQAMQQLDEQQDQLPASDAQVFRDIYASVVDVPFEPETAVEVCRLVELTGHTLRRVLEDNQHLPTFAVITRWRKRVPEFNAALESAEAAGVEIMGDEILTIADSLNDKDELSGGAVQAAKLQVNSRQWLMERLNRERWGQKGPEKEAPPAMQVSFSFTMAPTGPEPTGRTLDVTGELVEAMHRDAGNAHLQDVGDEDLYS